MARASASRVSGAASSRAVKDAIGLRARHLGFDAVGLCAAVRDAGNAADLATFLDRGLQGDMDWLARHRARRTDPRTLWPEARTIVALGVNYGPGGTGVSGDPLAILKQRDRAAISVYARGRDYHDVVKKKLKALGRWMVETLDCQVKVFVDTAPVMEKPAAARAGIGWQGKHTNLLSREFGSWLFLGEVFTDLDLPADDPAVDHCGSCDACRQACPTDALPAPRRIDPTRCISYLTIEHKGPIAADLMAAMGNRVYGCDDCLAVCPWNKFATPTTEPGLMPRVELTAPRLSDLATLDEAQFRRLFAGSPIKRTGRDRFLRNVAIAVGNSGDPSLGPTARRLAEDASPLVREAGGWAECRLRVGEDD